MTALSSRIDHAARLDLAQAHLDALYPPMWRPTDLPQAQQYFLVRSHPDPTRRTPAGKPLWLSNWHRLPMDLAYLTEQAIINSGSWDEYYSVNLGSATCKAASTQRLKNGDVVVAPGLLGDWDGRWGNHKQAEHLPHTPDKLLSFLHGLPTPPTIIIDTGGGFHTYHLFAEPWVLATPEDRAAFLDLATRFQETVEALAQDCEGWSDTSILTADLARVLRLPGTINHKYGTVVTPISTDGPRHTPSELSAWLAPRRKPTPTKRAGTSATPTGTLDIWGLAEHYGAVLTAKNTTEWHGGHPVHGSDTGTNFSIKPEEQKWHCFRHASGGVALDFLAMCEGLLQCEDAKPGGLRGAAYVQSVEIANTQWHAGIVLDERQARLEAQIAADDVGAAAHDAKKRRNGQHAPQGDESPGKVSLADSLVSSPELLALTLPAQRYHLDWLPDPSLVMVYGPRGVGKTYWLLELALCLSMPRKFLKWSVEQSVPVLFVDGEMSLTLLQDRLRQLAGDHPPQGLHWLPSELVYTRSGRDLTLTDKTHRLDLDTILQERGIKVLILDNISCLFPGIDESKKQDWEPINAWLIRLRHRGITVIVGHHSGKNGCQRGTSGREDHLNTILALTRPPGHQAPDGCHVHMQFEKTRGVKGEAVEALDVRLEDSAHGSVWTYAPLEARRNQRIKMMLEDGMPAKLVADELGISPSYVYRQKRDLGL